MPSSTQTPPDPIQPSADPNSPLACPDLLFNSWKTTQGFAESTVTVYSAMFNHLTTWLATRHIPFAACEDKHLAWFLDSNGLKKHHRYRYLRLVERLFEHRRTLGNESTYNPGSKAAAQLIGVGENDSPNFLTLAQRTALIAAVQAILGLPIGEQKAGEKAKLLCRDAGIVATMLGGGLRVGQVAGLPVNCIDFLNNKITISDEKGRVHRATLLPFAREALAQWIAIKETLGMGGELLFPAARGKKSPTGKTLPNRMHAVTLFRRTQEFMATADITGDRACAQTLRNSYAGQVMDEGAPDEILREYLGLAELTSASRLRLSYQDWQEVQRVKQQAGPSRP
jgi:integrase